VKNDTWITEADLFVIDLRLVHNDLKGAIEDAQYHYQIPVDKRRTPVPKIEVGNYVFILARFIKSIWPTKKTIRKVFRSFRGYRETRYSLIPNQTPQSPPCYPSCLPHIAD